MGEQILAGRQNAVLSLCANESSLKFYSSAVESGLYRVIYFSISLTCSWTLLGCRDVLLQAISHLVFHSPVMHVDSCSRLLETCLHCQKITDELTDLY